MRHPKFWNNELQLSPKQRSRKNSRKNSVCQIEDNYCKVPSDCESSSSKKSKGGYISKKRALEIERQRTSEIEDQKRKRDKRLMEEDDYGWSNHIMQL